MLLIKIFIQQNFPELKLALLLGLKKKIKQQGLEQVIDQLIEALDHRIDKQFMLNSLKIMQGFMQLGENYSQQQTDFPIRLIRAKQRLGVLAGKDNGWSALNNNLEIIQTQMSHFELLKQPVITAELIHGSNSDS